MSDGNSVKTIDVMRRWAPVVYFEKKEVNFPSSVEWYLDKVQIVDKDGKVHGPPVTTTLLRHHSDGTHNPSNEYELNIPVDSQTEQQVRPGEPLTTVVKNSTKIQVSTAPAYCHGRRIDDDTVDLQYYFFPYDDPVGAFDSWVGAHEGDWEHVTVRIAWSKDYTPNQGGDPMAAAALDAVYYAAHDGEGHWAGSPHLERCDDNYSHPVAYCARGTHASYSGTTYPVSWNRFFSQDYLGDTGARWYTYANIVQVQWDDPLPDSLAWLGFNGKWGATNDKYGSPYGPAMKPEWQKGDPGSPDMSPAVQLHPQQQ